MTLDIKHIGNTGPEGLERPYFPFHAALEAGILDLNQLNEMAANPVDPPGVLLTNGYIPNTKGAGVVPLGIDKFAAFDHAGLTFGRHSLTVNPVSKLDVDHKGRIAGEGVIIMGTNDGRLKVAAFAIDVVAHPWTFHNIRSDHRRVVHASTGRIAIVPASSLDLPEYEVSEINLDTGQIKAVPRHHYY